MDAMFAPPRMAYLCDVQEKEFLMRLSIILIGGMAALAGMLATTAVVAGSAKSISKTCGATTVTIACAIKSTDCTQTTLTLKTRNEKSRALSKPKGLGDYTAVGLACVSANDHTNYISVQYGSLPEGCEFCEWIALYSTKGELMTHNDPPILNDETLPEGHQQHPNNQEYSAASKRLGLTKPKFDFFPQ